MNDFLIIATLLIGVIGANTLKQFIPKVPEAFILILTGLALSFVPIFKNFELEPEFFMLFIIAPLMFIEGQKQSFKKISKNFSRIIVLSVVLSVVSALMIGLIASRVEVHWTLPLSIALAAIVVPTDAMAVKSMTSGSDIPKSVDDDLQLESLFNDAVGLVLLDLALTVMKTGSLSLGTSITHFLVVAVGGIAVGVIVGYFVVMLRFFLNTHATSPELITIPISLLTPFAIYLLAEHFGVSGILAAVAAGIQHNWEANKLKLTTTSVQLTSKTIWNIVADILNDLVFLIMGLALPEVIGIMQKLGNIEVYKLLGLSVLMYLGMILLRFLWSMRTNKRDETREHSRFLALIFAVSGVHGTITLAMAFSLPNTLGGQAFPYRNELIIVATLVILLSLVVSSIVLPFILPQKEEEFSTADLDATRNKMIDYAILQMREVIDNHDKREILTAELQSQKSRMNASEREDFSKNSSLLLDSTKELVSDTLQKFDESNKYSMNTIDIYEKIMRRSLDHNHRGGFSGGMNQLKQSFRRFIHRLKHMRGELVWHTKHRVITKQQRKRFRDEKLRSDPRYAKKANEWKSVYHELLDLNADVIESVDSYLDEVLQQRIDENHYDNDFINVVRRVMDSFFDNVKRRYNVEKETVDDDLYIQAFQKEYDYVRTNVTNGDIPQPLASVLYTEINQAQLLQLYQTEE
ncbi:sodium:proton antiporter [Lactobacillus sp. YT155]|uniref:cation:proton antiporter n=1 Tax=Lactobacillus sp. YT155 TaxID=3060955 RepID=UPI00265F9608|nr:sodium:proton antiporter [Lactobacillus sp. YT155]MDO1604848.1 sodium:proton antiporter [Lactobacillus sp. YT155]